MIFFFSFYRICHKRRYNERNKGDWGERCVEVFRKICQIGEGTYGQVYKAEDTFSSKFLSTIILYIVSAIEKLET